MERLMTGPGLLLAFIICLAIPGTFSLGPVNLSIYKILLLLICIPLGLRWISGQAGPVTVPDIFFLLSSVWIAISLVYWHGSARIVFVGTNFVELFGGYLVGRVLVRDVTSHRNFFRYTFWVIVALLPFAMFESLTGNRIINTTFGLIFDTPSVWSPQRLGLTRVAGPFPHPILFGLFCSVLFANLFFILRGRGFRTRFVTLGTVVFATGLSISAGPLFSIIIQTLMICWDRGMRIFRTRWIFLIVVTGTLGATLLLMLKGGLFDYIVENLLFSQAAGEHRLDIWKYGTAEVLRHPLFGVGMNDWSRPFWRPHPTIDTLWLAMAIRFGLPSVVFLLIGVLISTVLMSGRKDLTEEESACRSGYLITLAGLIFALTTVYIWGAVSIFIMAYFGAGAWLYNAPPAQKMPVRNAAATRRRPSGAAGTRDNSPPRPSKAEKPPRRKHTSAPPAKRPLDPARDIRSRRREL